MTAYALWAQTQSGLSFALWAESTAGRAALDGLERAKEQAPGVPWEDDRAVVQQALAPTPPGVTTRLGDRLGVGDPVGEPAPDPAQPSSTPEREGGEPPAPVSEPGLLALDPPFWKRHRGHG